MAPSTPPAPAPEVSIARLPVTSPDLFGRQDELDWLDQCWDDGARIASVVAPGGVGKSALVWGWLREMQRDGWRGAERVYGWSFYDQGATDRHTSAEAFISAGLRWFGDANPDVGSPWDKGERLAGLIGDQRTLLVLDGVEPLQWGTGPEVEKIKDPALATLVRELGARDAGLCVITSRLPVREVGDFAPEKSRRLDLRTLSDDAGGKLLRARGVTGTDEELQKAVREYGGHSLALALLGSYLSEVGEGDVRRRHEIGPLLESERLGEHAQRVMAAYEKMFGEASAEVGVLRMLGLFDRPAGEGEIDALRAKPVVAGLTDAVVGIPSRKWNMALATLRRVGLVERGSANDDARLDAHPLVREYFGEQLRREQDGAWREGNRRLYEYLKRTAKPLPETLEEMEPLYEAVVHGCRAGRHQEARREVHRPRIRRGNQHFSTRKLGAFNSEVAVLSAFFDAPWERLAPGLSESDQALVLGMAGSALRALGRLPEAMGLLRLCLERRVAQKAWKNAALVACSVSEVLQARGELNEALEQARESVKLAEESHDPRRCINSMTTVAAAWLAMGRVKRAAETFEEAERMQATRRPAYPLLNSVQGFRYCDLLLDQGRGADVQRRAKQALDVADRNDLLLDIALGNLSLGRAHILGVQQGAGGDLDKAASYIKAAVDGLRRASQQEYLPLALLARAALHTYVRTYGQARNHLDEALTLAERCGFRLHACDAHLGHARLSLAQGDPASAEPHISLAHKIIDATGYHRRDEELAALLSHYEEEKNRKGARTQGSTKERGTSSAPLHPRALAVSSPDPGTPSQSVPAPDRGPLMPRAEPEILFAWAHLADTQFHGAGGPEGHRLVLGRLRDDLAGAEARGWPKLDAILVTGDVAFGGAPAHYAEALDWLTGVTTAAGVAKECIYVVPGNHDVDWSVGVRNVTRLVSSLRDGRENLDEALAHDRDLLVQRFAHYLAFAAGLAPPCGELFWVQKIEARAGLRVRLLGLDTALLSAAGGDDRGRLRVGHAQLAAGLDGLRPDELVVVLSHHPFREGWLADEKDAGAWVTNHAHVHLFAHVTEHDSEQATSGASGAFVRVAAGIVYAGGPGHDGHGYNVSAVVRAPDGSLALRVWPRRWSDRNKVFRTDVESLPEGSPYAEHRLRLAIAGAARPAPPPRAPSETPIVLESAPAPIVRQAPAAASITRDAIDIGIVIALPEELREFLRLTTGYVRYPTADLDSYVFTHAGYRCAVTLVGEMGETQAGMFTERLISSLDPAVIISIGIAGGVHDDLRAGDVHVPSQAVEYIQDAKASPAQGGGFAVVPGAPAYRADFALLKAVRSFEFTHRAQYEAWVVECGADLATLLPDAHQREGLVAGKVVRSKAKLLADGHVATGPVVGAAPAFSAWIRSHDRNMKSLEMESAAVLLAAQTRNQPKRALAIRGISDKGDADKTKLDDLEDGVLRKYAMRNAVRLLWALLEAKALPQNPQSPPPPAPRATLGRVHGSVATAPEVSIQILHLSDLHVRADDSRPTPAPPASLVLHLSDLHFGTPDDAKVWCSQLVADLRKNLACDRLDAVVLSGDIANLSTPGEYAAARAFVDKLRAAFHLAAHQVIPVPGNHDLDWGRARKAYRAKRGGAAREGVDFEESGTIQVRDDALYPLRFEPFAAFYEAVRGEPYPLDPAAQAIVYTLPAQRLLVLGLNSAWNLDHHFRARASIHRVALSEALDRIDADPACEGFLKIAMWHHPVDSPFEDRITDHGFLERLADAGFRLGLHGHVHKADNALYRPHMGDRRLEIVTAGTFGAPIREWVPGYPLQYQLLRIDGTTLTVETRRREEPNGAWKPDARWTPPGGKDPLPRYTLPLG